MSMEPLSPDSCKELLDRFERFDGALLPRIHVDLVSSAVELWFEAFDTTVTEVGGKPLQPSQGPHKEQYKIVILRIEGLREFALAQHEKESQVLLVDGIEILWIDGSVFFVGDPLFARDFSESNWTIGQVRTSRLYCGGATCSWRLGDSDSIR